MADEIVQQILLEGDAEILHKLSELGEQGFETLKQFGEAFEAGSSKLELFGNALGILSAAFVGLSASLAAFVSEQTEAIQKASVLAEAFGTTAENAHSLAGAFAQMNVSAATFEQFVERIIVTIARDWPQITQAVRNSATAQDEAQSRIVSATLRVQDAQRNLANVTDQESSKIVQANLRVEQTMTALQFSAARAAAETRRNYDALRNAALSLEAAEQRLAELQGRPVSDAEKKSLEIRQAQQAVENARAQQAEARLKQQQATAEAAQKQASIEAAAADAQLKRSTLIQELANSRQKAELQLREAINGRAEAEQKAAQSALKDLPTIERTIKAITSGNKDAAREIDIAKVSVQDLTKGLILAASSGIAGKAPDGFKVMSELSQLLAKDTDHLIDKNQRLALVQALGTRSQRAANVSTIELLHALEQGPEFFDKFASHAEHAFATSEKGIENAKNFQKAITGLGFAVESLNRDLAAAAAPFFTDFLRAVQGSLESSTGTLHLFVEGIKAIGTGIGFVVTKFQEAAQWVDKTFNLEKGRAMQIFIGLIVIAVAAFASAWLAIPALITAVVVALGYVASKWDDIKKAASEAWAVVKDSSVYKFLDGAIEKAKELWKWLNATKQPNKKASGGSDSGSSNTPSPPSSFATGGEVHGPGSATSDSILARLSDGEFVVKADAVAAYGASFFHSLNSMQFPGFAAGGLVSAPQRLSSGGASMAPQSVLNLTIDGQTFSGLKGSKNVVDSLSAFAVGRQTASAGRRPGWNK